MSKNNKLINSMKALAKQNQARNVAKASNEMVPIIYASIALALVVLDTSASTMYLWNHRGFGKDFLVIQRT